MDSRQHIDHYITAIITKNLLTSGVAPMGQPSRYYCCFVKRLSDMHLTMSSFSDILP